MKLLQVLIDRVLVAALALAVLVALSDPYGKWSW